MWSEIIVNAIRGRGVYRRNKLGENWKCEQKPQAITVKLADCGELKQRLLLTTHSRDFVNLMTFLLCVLLG